MTLMNESVFPGEYASWSCEVQSTIPLQFMWYLDDQLVSNVTGSHMNVIASSSYTLNNVNYSDDNSNVRCSVAGSELIVNSSDVYLTGKLQYFLGQPNQFNMYSCANIFRIYVFCTPYVWYLYKIHVSVFPIV